MINSLKKAAVVATLFTVVSSLTPKSAEAGFARFSGRAINTRTIDFNLDTDVSSVDGLFSGAVKDFNIRNSSGDIVTSFCGVAICPPGNLKVSKLVTDTDGFVSNLRTPSYPGEKITLNGLQTVFDILGPSGINFSGDVVRYDLSFGTASEPELVWFVQSNDPNLTTNLSKLTEFSNIRGIFPDDIFEGANGGIFRLNSNSQPVPEPNSSLVGLVGVGMLGAASLRYKKRLQMKTVVEKPQ